MRLVVHGILALGCYAIHAGYYLSVHQWNSTLWACHVSCVVIGVGCFLRRSVVVASGLSFLSVGFPLWIVDLATGGTLIPTSLFTHIGGVVIGVSAMRELGGWPRGAWWKGALGMIALEIFSRLVTRPENNINLVFSVQPGWERTFPSFPAYFLLLALASTLTFFLLERVALVVAPRFVGPATHGARR